MEQLFKSQNNMSGVNQRLAVDSAGGAVNEIDNSTPRHATQLHVTKVAVCTEQRALGAAKCWKVGGMLT